ncbi:MAG: class I SAM-dependent methyltransferase [Brachymonas denitrificans]|uniref:class I SAM-dependent methyltransferase n=1 Tax=Brachymonas denitrificans TaxID=28220 RepID=UPI001BCD1CC5|nr:class I SAM-dependent methyltransferase [Brachymonas denitrificans]
MTGGATHRLPHALWHAASERYRPAGRFAWHFARGKLRHDPAFATVLARGWIRPGSRVLDLGCGQGLLASLLLAVDGLAHAPHWPAHWAPPPQGCRVHGLELMPRDVERAQAALAGHELRARVDQGDIAQAAFGAADVVVLLDVLHYLPHAGQEAVLRRVHDCLAPGGQLVLRIGDHAAGLPFRLSQLVDRIIFRARGHADSSLYCRTADDWAGLLGRHGLEVLPGRVVSGSLFANTLMLARKPGGA